MRRERARVPRAAVPRVRRERARPRRRRALRDVRRDGGAAAAARGDGVRWVRAGVQAVRVRRRGRRARRGREGGGGEALTTRKFPTPGEVRAKRERAPYTIRSRAAKQKGDLASWRGTRREKRKGKVKVYKMRWKKVKKP